MIAQPEWYGRFEQKLLSAKPLLLLALGGVIVVSSYFFWEVWHDRKAVPAAVWTVYLYMP